MSILGTEFWNARMGLDSLIATLDTAVIGKQVKMFNYAKYKEPPKVGRDPIYILLTNNHKVYGIDNLVDLLKIPKHMVYTLSLNEVQSKTLFINNKGEVKRIRMNARGTEYANTRDELLTTGFKPIRLKRVKK